MNLDFHASVSPAGSPRNRDERAGLTPADSMASGDPDWQRGTTANARCGQEQKQR
jgi:hypothetical protein